MNVSFSRKTISCYIWREIHHALTAKVITANARKLYYRHINRDTTHLLLHSPSYICHLHSANRSQASQHYLIATGLTIPSKTRKELVNLSYRIVTKVTFQVASECRIKFSISHNFHYLFAKKMDKTYYQWGSKTSCFNGLTAVVDLSMSKLLSKH